MCDIYKPMFTAYQEQENDLLKDLFQKLVFEIPALLPSLDNAELAAMRSKGVELTLKEQIHNMIPPPPEYNATDIDPSIDAMAKKFGDMEYPHQQDSLPDLIFKKRKKRSIDPTPEHVNWAYNRGLWYFLQKSGLDHEETGRHYVAGTKMFSDNKRCVLWDELNDQEQENVDRYCRNNCTMVFHSPEQEGTESNDTVTVTLQKCYKYCRTQMHLLQDRNQTSPIQTYEELLQAIGNNTDLLCFDQSNGRIISKRDTHVPLRQAMKVVEDAVGAIGIPESEDGTDLESIVVLAPYLENIPEEVFRAVPPPALNIVKGCRNRIQKQTRGKRLAQQCNDCILALCTMTYYEKMQANLFGTNQTAEERHIMLMMRSLSSDANCHDVCTTEEREAYRSERSQFLSSNRNTGSNEQIRRKRSTRLKRNAAVILQGTLGLAGLIKDGIGMFLDHRRNKHFQAAINTLTSNQNKLGEHIQVLNKEMVAMAQLRERQIDEIWTEIVDQRKVIEGQQVAMIRVAKKAQANKISIVETAMFQAWIDGAAQTAFRVQQDLLIKMQSAVDDFMTAIDHLSSGMLSHEIVPPASLACYLKELQDNIHKNFPLYELAIPELNKYYDMRMISYVADNSSLFVNIPILLQQVNQASSELFQVKTIPIPLNPDKMTPNDEGKWVGDYTHIVTPQPYLAIQQTTEGISAISISKHDLEECFRFGANYYCIRSTHKVYKPDHLCALSMFLDKLEDVKEYCHIDYLNEFTPDPTILQDETHILLVAMPPPWSKRCSAGSVFAKDMTPSAVAVLPRSGICSCDLHLGEFSFPESLADCDPNTEHGAKIQHIVNTLALFSLRKYIDDEYFKRRQDKYTIREQDVVQLISGNLLLDEPSDIDIPELESLVSFTTDPETIEERRQLAKLDLKDIITSVEQNVPILATTKNAMNIERDFIIALCGVSITFLILMVAIWNCSRTAKCHKVGDLTDIELQDLAASRLNLAEQFSTPPRYSHDNRAYTRENSPEPPRRQMQDREPTPHRVLRNSDIRRSARAKSLTRHLMALTILMIFTTFVEPTAAHRLQQDEYNDQKPEKATIKWQLTDLLIFAGCTLTALLIVGILFAFANWALTLKRNPLAATKSCRNIFCRGWSDQCQVFLQVSTFACYQSVRMFIGSILGPPIGLQIEGSLQIEQIKYGKGFFYDVIKISWDSVHLKYQGRHFPFPTKVKLINPRQRWLARHLFGDRKAKKICNIAVIYNDTLIIRQLETLTLSKRTQPTAPTMIHNYTPAPSTSNEQCTPRHPAALSGSSTVDRHAQECTACRAPFALRDPMR